MIHVSCICVLNILQICLCISVLGDLLLVDVENKDISFSKTTESEVTSLVWVQHEKPQKKDTIDSVLIKVIIYKNLVASTIA